jgi:hypothetical protein
MSCSTISCGSTQTLKVTPAMQAGVTDRLWTIEDILKLVEDYREERWKEERGERIERSYNRSVTRWAARD